MGEREQVRVVVPLGAGEAGDAGVARGADGDGAAREGAGGGARGEHELGAAGAAQPVEAGELEDDPAGPVEADVADEAEREPGQLSGSWVGEDDRGVVKDCDATRRRSWRCSDRCRHICSDGNIGKTRQYNRKQNVFEIVSFAHFSNKNKRISIADDLTAIHRIVAKSHFRTEMY